MEEARGSEGLGAQRDPARRVSPALTTGLPPLPRLWETRDRDAGVRGPGGLVHGAGCRGWSPERVNFLPSAPWSSD